MPAPCWFVANKQMGGHSASHPEGGSCTVPRPIFGWTFTMANNSILADRIPEFRQSCALPRACAHAVRLQTPTAPTRVKRAARKASRSKWYFLRFFRAFCPPACLAEGSSGPAAGYSGLANPSSQLTVCCEKPPTHVHRQSLGREPGRAAVVPGINERIERIGLSWRLFAIRKFRVAYNNENLKSK